MRMNVAQSIAGPGKIVHASTNQINSPGATRLRRRLSEIFQRAISGSGLRLVWPLAFGVRGNNQRMICQSPRVQRCRRLAYASYEDGYSSRTSISVVSAARANNDSNKS